MKYVNITNTELTVSQVCLGTSGFGSTISESDAFEMLDRFTDGGGSFIDTANVYGRWQPGGLNLSEQIIGKWLRERKAYDKLIVATKAAHYSIKAPSVMRLGEDEIRSDLEESLMTLGLDHIDMLWLHRDDPKRPIENIIDTMEKLVAEGKIRYYGASNFTVGRLKEAAKYAASIGKQGFCAVSNQWNPAQENLVRQSYTDPTLVHAAQDLALYKDLDMSFIPYNSTAKGFFQKFANGDIYSEKYTRLREKYLNQPNIDLCDKLIGESKIYGVSVQTELLRMIISGGFMDGLEMIPITSVTKPENIDDILAV